MTITRRALLRIALPLAAHASATRLVFAQRGTGTDRVARIRQIIQAFSDQGDHRTGTAVDRASAEWLSAEVRARGLTPSLEPFSLSRVDPQTAAITVDGRRVNGLPLFDGGFTGAAGITGRIGPVDTDVEIGVAETAPNAAARGPLGDARRAARHQAIVCVTGGAKPGLCPSNADAFLTPFGPPVLQISSEHAPWLDAQSERRTTAHVVAEVTRTPVEAFNVTAAIAGTDASLPPLVIMTPRSGWYTCASERGGGIACWLELMGTLRAASPARTIVFVASSGHELGHLGINAFVERRPGIVKNSVGWMHFGANIGASSQRLANTVQASDDEMQGRLEPAMTANGLTVDTRVPHTRVPGGEAEVVHRGGGRYVSVIGASGLFHHPDDRGADVSDARAIDAFIEAFTAVARSLASRQS
jgi:hypothetical protein